jgi:hypothetical protein
VVIASDFNTINIDLEKLGINGLMHRLVIKLSSFFHKLFNEPNAPVAFKQNIIFNKDLNKHYNLRNLSKIYIPGSDKNNNYGNVSFSIFFPKFINEICIDDLNINFCLFRTRIENNVNISFLKFLKTFPKFDINFIENYLNYQSSLKNSINSSSIFLS